MFDSSICVPISSRSEVATAPLMAATVPTFMNTGVCTVPCTVVNSACFAFPSFFTIRYIYRNPLAFNSSMILRQTGISTWYAAAISSTA